jgi:hypothetical protein
LVSFNSFVATTKIGVEWFYEYHSMILFTFSLV